MIPPRLLLGLAGGAAVALDLGLQGLGGLLAGALCGAIVLIGTPSARP